MITEQTLGLKRVRVPAWAIDRARQVGWARRLARRWVSGRDVRIAAGVGAGLRFNAADSNPAYSLGTNELPVQEALVQQLRPGDTFYDVGANVGFFTVIAARLVGPAGRVFAFEPVPSNARAIRHNLALNRFGNVTVVEAAVAARSGRGDLLVAHLSGGSALATASPPPDVKEVIGVDLVSVDELVRGGSAAPPSFVKVDVEGGELAVLQGMTATILQHRPVVLLEIDDDKPESFLRKREAVDLLLRSFGYTVEPLADSYVGGQWLVGHYLAIPIGRSR